MKDGRWETNKKRPEDEEVPKEKIVENIMWTEEEKEYIGQQEVNKKTEKMKKINKHKKITKGACRETENCTPEKWKARWQGK